MCGIVGFVDSLNKSKKDKIIRDMSKKIIHRGPDSEGIYTDDSVALGFRKIGRAHV